MRKNSGHWLKEAGHYYNGSSDLTHDDTNRAILVRDRRQYRSSQFESLD